MIEYDQKDPKDIERYGKRLLGKTLRVVQGMKSIPVEKLDKLIGRGNRDGFGSLLERYYYGITPPNTSAPDFPEANVELKSTPVLKKSKKGFRAKERLVLNLINYNDEAKKDFKTSSFYTKNAKIMLVSYLHIDKSSVGDLPVKMADLFEFEKLPLEDRMIIENDWNIINQKIRLKRAHEISEGDTIYLGACTKGVTGLSTRPQEGGVRAKPRAYAYKGSYISSLFYGDLQDSESVVEINDIKKFGSIEEAIAQRFDKYIGMTVEEIRSAIASDIKKTPKDILAWLGRRMLGVRTKKIAEFEKGGIVMKTIRLDLDGTPTEHMSFPYFRFADILDEKWDGDEEKGEKKATVQELFEKRFFFVIFQHEDNNTSLKGKITFKKVMFWTMPQADLEGEARLVWEKTKMKIKESDPENFPSTKESPVSHVRPHGRRGKDIDKLPDGSSFTKQAFWLNKEYIKKQVESGKREKRG